jgi:hypothetical protein
VLLAFVLLLASMMGALLGLSAYLPVFALLALVAGAAILMSPRLAVWVALVGALCIAGLIELYLPGLQQVRWLFSLLSIVLMLVATVRFLAQPRQQGTAELGGGAVVLLCFVCVACAVAGALAAGMPSAAALVGLKNYFQMWGVLAALAVFGYEAAQVSKFIRLLAMLALVQMPFVLHQFLVLVPQRSTQAASERFVVAVDVVAGTFGGSMAGGGRSSDLAILAAIAIVYFFARWKAGQSSLLRAALLSALAFCPMLFNEAKLALVLIPLGLLLLFPQAILRRPLTMLLGSVAVLGALVGVLALYAALPGADAQRAGSIDRFLRDSLDYNVGQKGYGSAVLNRSTVYGFWWREHVRRGDWKGAVFGHGPGVTNPASATASDTLATTRYRGYAIGLTGISTLLWETGMLGTAVFVSLLLAAALLARRLALDDRLRPWRAELQTAQIGLLFLGVSLLHNNYIAFDLGYQAMMVLLLGYVLAMRANLRRTAVSAAGSGS